MIYKDGSFLNFSSKLKVNSKLAGNASGRAYMYALTYVYTDRQATQKHKGSSINYWMDEHIKI